MAISSVVLTTTFLFPDTSSSSSSLKPSSAMPVQVSPVNSRTVRIVTLATASPEPVTGKRGPRGIMKPRRVSPEMAALVGAPEIPRTQALKHIWAYIKQHNLQDPDNKKVIICDEKLKKIFGGRDRVGFLEIAGLISPHFL